MINKWDGLLRWLGLVDEDGYFNCLGFAVSMMYGFFVVFLPVLIMIPDFMLGTFPTLSIIGLVLWAYWMLKGCDCD